MSTRDISWGVRMDSV